MTRIPHPPTRVWVAAFVSLALISTVALWIAGNIGTAARLTAYATAVLAIGTVGLAGGAIGTYVEQRKATAAQAEELTEQNRQLDRARENDIAQVSIKRRSGSGEPIIVEVENNSARAIRFVYVWVSVKNMSNYYETIVRQRDPRTGHIIRSRRMQNTPRVVDGYEITQCYRSLLSGEAETFAQYAVTNPQEMPNVDDAWVTAHALFQAIDGAWWKCSQDGEIEKLDAEPVVIHRPQFVIETGLDKVIGPAKFNVHRSQASTDSPEQS